ncbi:MAG: response regulator [Anaerolineae bacterium]|nr:response regulator [Anaerolineae bacterium]
MAPVDMIRDVILIVDDVPANLNVLHTHLQHVGFKVLVAQDGVQALAIAQRAQPDLILLDVMMPELDGFETCRQLKMQPTTRDIPVIFMTVLSDPNDKIRGFDVGGIDYVTKPVHPSEVLARVNTHLTLRRLQRQLERQNEEWEARARERTLELIAVNAHLQAEVERRQEYEHEKDHLMDVIGRQNELLRSLTEQLIAQQQATQTYVTHTLHEDIEQALTHLEVQLDTLGEQLARNTSYMPPPSLLDAHATLMQVQTYVHSLSDHLYETGEKLTDFVTTSLYRLSPRELEIFELLAGGESPQEIAQILNISTKTVYKHRSSIFEKLNIQSISELMKLALRQNVISLD